MSLLSASVNAVSYLGLFIAMIVYLYMSAVVISVRPLRTIHRNSTPSPVRQSYVRQVPNNNTGTKRYSEYVLAPLREEDAVTATKEISWFSSLSLTLKDLVKFFRPSGQARHPTGQSRSAVTALDAGMRSTAGPDPAAEGEGRIFLDSEELRSAVDLWLKNQEAAVAAHGHISEWNVSAITDMSELFAYVMDFQEDISRWDVSSVRNMSGMFRFASSFASDMSSWNVSSVVDFSYCFDSAGNFQSDLSAWELSSARDLSFMFRNAIRFDSDVSLWFGNQNQVGQPVHGRNEIEYAVRTTESMFEGAVSFRGRGLSRWRTGSVVNMNSMFRGARELDAHLTNWDVRAVRDFRHMFRDATAFSQGLCWEISDSARIEGMLHGSNAAFIPDCLPADAQSAA